MNKRQLDNIVEELLKKTRISGRQMTRKEVENWAGTEYSKDQKERIFYRYRYLLQESQKMQQL